MCNINHDSEDQSPDPVSPRRSFTRRKFVQGLTALLATATTGCQSDKIGRMLQRNLREMSREELKETLARLEREYKESYGVDIKVHSTPPTEGVLFAYGLDLSRCVGCRRCAKACVRENNQSRANADGKHNMPIEWIRVLQMEKEDGVDVSEATPYYAPEKVPAEGKFYMPVQCHQCENPSCVKVCPVGATWKERDGIVAIDYDWCIGCRYCMVACPYGARRFNWTTPHLPAKEVNTNTHVLGNRPRYKGVVEKCTFCIHRTRTGRYPACAEACPVGARKFGNILDPESEIRYLLENKRVFVFKEELNNKPRFFYFYS